MQVQAKQRTGSNAWHSVRRAGTALVGARRRIATLAVVILAVAVGYHVVFGRNGLVAYSGKRAQIRSIREQMTDLQQENTRLRHHVDRLTSDPDAVEHEARESLHYTRPGEVIYTMPPDAHTPHQ